MSNQDLIIKKDVFGANYNVTPLLETWTQCVTLGDFNADGSVVGQDSSKFLLKEAYLNSDDIPLVGQKHDEYDKAYCTRVSIQSWGGSGDPIGVRALSEWAQPGDFSAAQFDTYQTYEIRNIDISGNTTKIPFSPADKVLGAINKNQFIADLKTPYILRALRITQYETMDDSDDNKNPKGLFDADECIWNNDEIWGCDKGTLLYIGKQVFNDGTPILKVVYNFLYDARAGWHHRYAVWVDNRGLKPSEVVILDPSKITPEMDTVFSDANGKDPSKDGRGGSAAFKMLPDAEFATYFAGIKKPWNIDPGSGNTGGSGA